MENNEIIPKELELVLAEEKYPMEQLQTVRIDALQVMDGLRGLKVSNKDAYEKAVALGSQNKRLMNQFEAMRKALIKPFQDRVKFINGAFQKVTAYFEANDEKLRADILKYQESLKSVEKIQNVQTSEGSATIQSRADYEIVDEAKLPREYLKPDLEKIGRLVRGRAVTEIPGVRIFETKSTAFKVA